MLDIKFLRANPEIVKQNIKNKFQDSKLKLVDEVIELDVRNREIKQEVEALRAEKNKVSKQIGALMAQGKKEEAEEVKKRIAEDGQKIEQLSVEEKEVEEKIKTIMMTIPNIIDPSVPIGKDDSENVELQKPHYVLLVLLKSKEKDTKFTEDMKTEAEVIMESSAGRNRGKHDESAAETGLLRPPDFPASPFTE